MRVRNRTSSGEARGSNMKHLWINDSGKSQNDCLKTKEFGIHTERPLLGRRVF